MSEFSQLSDRAGEAFHHNPEGISCLTVPETGQCNDSYSIVGGTAQGTQGAQGATAEVPHESEEDVFLNHLLYD